MKTDREDQEKVSYLLDLMIWEEVDTDADDGADVGEHLGGVGPGRLPLP